MAKLLFGDQIDVLFGEVEQVLLAGETLYGVPVRAEALEPVLGFGYFLVEILYAALLVGNPVPGAVPYHYIVVVQEDNPHQKEYPHNEKLIEEHPQQGTARFGIPDFLPQFSDWTGHFISF